MSSQTSKSLTPPTIAQCEGDVPNRLQQYANEHSLRMTPMQNSLLKESEGMEKAVMSGAPDEANFLCLLLELLQAKTVVEVGVFRGLTTLALAECLKQMEDSKSRKIIGLDISEEYAAVGKEHWKKAGVDDLIDFRVGDAKENMTKLISELGENSVDFAFIDADKVSYDDYYEKALKLVRPGGLIVVDNTLWGGSVIIPPDKIDSRHGPGDIRAIQALNDKIAKDDRVTRVCFLTIADGVTICRVK